MEIEKTKALISIYNELYCQTTMEYNALAAFVGVQLDSSHDGMSESVSQISSAAISARRRMNLEFERRNKEELENT